jgi:hypothetical protein
MTTSRVPQVLSYLVTAFTNAATLGQASPPVNILDGPKVTADPVPLALWVGADDISAGAGLVRAAESFQQFQPGLDRRNRQEQLTVNCVAQAWSGSDDVPGIRAAAVAILAAVEDLLAADPGLGGTLPGSPSALITDCQWQQESAPSGTTARVTFTITATALISAP